MRKLLIHFKKYFITFSKVTCSKRYLSFKKAFLNLKKKKIVSWISNDTEKLFGKVGNLKEVLYFRTHSLYIKKHLSFIYKVYICVSLQVWDVLKDRSIYEIHYFQILLLFQI